MSAPCRGWRCSPGIRRLHSPLQEAAPGPARPPPFRRALGGGAGGGGGAEQVRPGPVRGPRSPSQVSDNPWDREPGWDRHCGERSRGARLGSGSGLGAARNRHRGGAEQGGNYRLSPPRINPEPLHTLLGLGVPTLGHPELPGCSVSSGHGAPHPPSCACCVCWDWGPRYCQRLRSRGPGCAGLGVSASTDCAHCPHGPSSVLSFHLLVGFPRPFGL